jgi:hypothetical protein
VPRATARRIQFVVAYSEASKEWLEGTLCIATNTESRNCGGTKVPGLTSKVWWPIGKTWLKSKNPLSEAVRREREEDWSA